MRIEKFSYFYPERPALIHAEQELFGRLSRDPNWIGELKFNGQRLQLHRPPSGNFEFWNRHGERLSYTPAPELATALAGLPLEAGKYYLFDGELRHGKTKGVRHKIVLYDCFIFAGELLNAMPFQGRRQILETLEHYSGLDDRSLSIAYQFPDHFDEVFGEVTQDPEIEGLVLKDLRGKLNLGRKRGIDSAWMMKVRRPNNSYHF